MDKSFMEKLQIEIDYMQHCVDQAEARPNDEKKDQLTIYHYKSFRNGLIRAKRLFEGEPTNVG